MNNKLSISLIVLLLLNLSITSDSDITLPDYPYTTKKMKSGYLDIQNNTKHLHYMLVPTEGDATKDPLVLWLNGGPGCSSMLGFAYEHGPASFLEESTTFALNPFSWNKKATILYIESPVGVGYSYADNAADELVVSDESSARDNLEGVKAFFVKYPELHANDFYITGESYAGIYVPMLSYKILQYNKTVPKDLQINLKGLAVGNGVADWSYDTEPAYYDFAYTHYLYPKSLRVKYERYCLPPYADPIECQQYIDAIDKYLEGINVYDVYRKCYKSQQLVELIKGEDSEGHYAGWKHKGEKNGTDVPPCTDSIGSLTYFNRQDVQAAMKIVIPSGRDKWKWLFCSGRIEDAYQIDKINGSYKIYPQLIQAGLRVWIYSGDTDGAVPINGTMKWIKNLKLNVNKEWTAWSINNYDVSGYRIIYDGLTFVSIKGTGHMVPQWKPKEAFQLFSSFLLGEDLVK